MHWRRGGDRGGRGRGTEEGEQGKRGRRGGEEGGGVRRGKEGGGEGEGGGRGGGGEREGETQRDGVRETQTQELQRRGKNPESPGLCAPVSLPPLPRRGGSQSRGRKPLTSPISVLSLRTRGTETF